MSDVYDNCSTDHVSSCKRKGDPSTYKVNKVKAARLKGEGYVNHRGKDVVAKKPGFSCRCTRKCLYNLGEDNCLDVFVRFYDLPNKNAQDLFLQGLIDVEQVKQRRPQDKDNPKIVKGATFRYHVIVGTVRMKVCMHAFLSIFSVSEKRVRRIRDLKMAGKIPVDKRGRGITNSLSADVHETIHEHIRSFPLHESHYTGEKVFYLSSELSIKKMWKLFKYKYPQFSHISYYTYWSDFTKRFGYRFGRPQADTCCTCEELNLKIKSPHLNDVAKRAAVADLVLHKRRSSKFYSALKYEASEEGNKESNVLSIAMDYMQNVNLPKIPVQELYYLRQLTVNVFCINNIKEKRSTMYVYHEGNGRKSPDEVCTFLTDFLKDVPQEKTELRVFTDSCAGQNKNQTVSRFLLSLTDMGRFEKIQQYFPVRGHSFLPCDRDFTIISKHLRKHDRIFTVHELTSHIIQSSFPGKFVVKEMTANDILEFKNWWQYYYRKNVISEETKSKPRNERINFSIGSLFHFVYCHERKGYMKGYSTVNGLIDHTFFMALKSGTPIQPSSRSYPTGQIPIKRAKLTDLTKITTYIPHEHKEYYSQLLSWPSVNASEQYDEH